jgi:hypothetical protein
MHKAKRNNNLSFSKGKTWQLEDMRVLEQIGVSLAFPRGYIGRRSGELNAGCGLTVYSPRTLH